MDLNRVEGKSGDGVQGWYRPIYIGIKNERVVK